MKENNVIYSENPDREVNLSSLILAIAAKWRNILTWMLLLGALCGVLFGVKEAREQQDPDYVAEVEQRNEFRQLQDAQTLAGLEASIQSINRALDQQKAFCEHSTQMTINPYEIYTISNTYYVDTDYKILPENDFQYPNLAVPVIKGYAACLSELDLSSLIFGAEAAEETAIFDWDKFFLQVDTRNADSGIIVVQASGSMQEQAEQIMALAEQTLERAKPMLEKSVCAHELSCLGSSRSAEANTSLISFQDAQRKSMETLAASLAKAVSDYNNFEDSELESLGTGSIVKTTVKFGVIGLALGFFLAAGYYLIVFLLGDYLLDLDEIETQYGISVLGVSGYDGKAIGLDRRIAEKRGIPTGSVREANLHLLAASLQRAAGSSQLCLVGSSGDAALSSLAEELAATGVLAKKPLVGGDINHSAELLGMSSQALKIVCVEELGRSRHADIRKELRSLSALGESCIGFVLFGKVGK